MINGIMPIPIIMNGGGGGRPETIIAIFLSIIIFILIWMLIRVIVLRNNEHFNKQSLIKNVFFDLNEYNGFLEPHINVPAFGLIVMLSLSLICWMAVLISKML